MGVSSTTNTVILSGDGVSVSFPFPYYFFTLNDLYVYIYDTLLGGITAKTRGPDFSISGTPNAQGLYPNGANVVFVAVPLATDEVVISRFPLEEQDYSLLPNGTISANATVQQFDYLTLLVQSLQDQVSRCVKLPAGFAPTFDTELPSDIGLAAAADEVIQVNPTNDGFVLGTLLVGPTGPQGPAGPAGSSGLSVSPASSNTVLVAPGTVNSIYIPADATAAPFSITLPAALLAVVGQVYHIKKIDSGGNSVSILPSGSDSILTTVSGAMPVLDFQGKCLSFVCRAAGFWDVI